MMSSHLAVVYPIFLASSIVLCRDASSAFTNDFCKTKCGTRRHTLCNQVKVHNCSYKSYYIYRSAELEDLDLRNQLLMAHNGLRERIASRMHVADMVLSKWSKQLATMAENWALQCRPYEDDECAHASLPMNVETLLNMTQANQEEMFVAMNRFCFTSLYLPRELLQMVFSRWYFEKDHLQAPKKTNFQNRSLALLSGENNFTHLADPRIRRIGCNVARYDNAYCIFCFYDPYYRHTDGILFAHGQPATHCPWQYPLRDLDFPNMCTRNIYLNADEQS
ncbi:PREDICTED: venom allergen 5.01-like [Bactrocera latifrons]|uniref:venom allergen 5.01-like n=1 Tax=Bactrocera latifrons TaxID=174628 RepID=UPI0008DE9621|nr:PREDICTED: venom allergen 5.01-like [Bactrocera latifrons]